MVKPKNPDENELLFITETNERERVLRAKWIRKNWNVLNEKAQFKSDGKHYTEVDIARHGMIDGMDTLKKDTMFSAKNRLKNSTDPAEKSAQNEININDHSNNIIQKRDIMFPVDLKTRRFLFESEAGFGRIEYLNERFKEKPENKYYNPECTSWDYGWRLSDNRLVQLQREEPYHGLVAHLLNDRKTNTDIKPDPEYYKSPKQLLAVTKCT